MKNILSMSLIIIFIFATLIFIYPQYKKDAPRYMTTQVSLCGSSFDVNKIILQGEDITSDIVNTLSKYKNLCSRELDKNYNFCLSSSENKNICKKDDRSNNLRIETKNENDFLITEISFRDVSDTVLINKISKNMFYLNSYDSSFVKIGGIK